MVVEGKTFVDAGEAAAWYEEKVREVMNDSEIVDEIFMLPRYDYSPTTWKHVHAFIQDCTSFTDLCASDMRRAFTDGSYCYHYAEGLIRASYVLEKRK